MQNIQCIDEEWITSLFSLVNLNKGQVLFHQGDSANSMCIVKSGELMKSFESETRSFVLSRHYPGDVIGEAEVLHWRRKRFVTTTAQQATSVWQIDHERLDKLLTKYPTLYKHLFGVIGERFVRAGRKIRYLAFMDARMRVVQLLVDYVSDHLQNHPSAPVPEWRVTQQELADLLGLNRESIARVISELQSHEVLVARRGVLQIADLQRLTEMAHTLPADIFASESVD